MKKWLVALSLAVLMIGSTFVFVISARADGSEVGVFPDRVFYVSKYRSDKSFSAEINPSSNGEWWVELVLISRGSVVTVTVMEVDVAGGEALLSSTLSTVGSESVRGYLYDGSSYSMSLTIKGGKGAAILQEHFVADNPPLPQGWQEPTLLQSLAEYEQAGSVGMDDLGNAMVIWEQPFTGNFSNESTGVWWIRYDHASGWGDPAKLWDGDFACGYTTLGVGPNGQAVASWYAAAPPYDSALYASLYDPVSGWSSPAVLHLGGEYGIMDADIDYAGNATVVVSSIASQVLTAWRHDVGFDWQSEVIVSGGASYPEFSYDANGYGILVWTDFGSQQVESSWYSPGIGWGPVMIASGSVGGYWAEMDIDYGGRCLAVFFKHNGTAWEMFGNLFDPVYGGWGTPTQIGPVADGWHPARGYVSADAQGNFFVIWQQSSSYSGGEGSVWSRVYSLATRWGPATKLSSGISADTDMYPCIAANWNGEVIASWTQNDGTVQSVLAARFTPGTGWSAPVVIDSSDEFRAYLSQVAIAPSGDSVAIWRQSDGVNDLLWGRVYLADISP